jgi:uncharacterized OB-fold protein
VSAFRPPISPSPDAAEFWDACRRGELVLPHCDSDGFFFYPRTACPTCGSRTWEWRRASGRGRVHAFTIVHATRLPGLAEATPFVPAIVELEEGVRMMSVLLGVEPDPEHVRCELPVEVDFAESEDGQWLPMFRPR